MEYSPSQHFRIVGIDPGTNTLGFSLLTFDLGQQRLHLEEAGTFTADRNVHRYPHLSQTHGERYARLYAHRQCLMEYFHLKQPNAVASESPFYSRLAQAFAALTECVYEVRQAVYDYDPHLPLFTYDPATVKKNVGVSGKSGDKDAMRRAILNLSFMDDVQKEQLQHMDEHAIDAVAVAYTHFLHLTQ